MSFLKHATCTVGVLLGLVIAFGVVGTMDYRDAQAERDHYCEMVATGAWPDYRETYDEECKP